jgi:pullulanase/glycogen debranching enzyme
MMLAGDEIGHTPGRQQQRLLPGQRDRLDRLGRRRYRFPGVHAQDDRLPPRPPDPAATALPACARTGIDGLEDLFWWRPDGKPMTQADWDDPEAKRALRRASDGLRHAGYAERNNALFLVFNAGKKDVTVKLPTPPAGQRWTHRIATTTAWFGKQPVGKTLNVPGPSVAVCGLDPHDD